MSKKRVLMIFVEPTPYILGMIQQTMSMSLIPVDVIFLKSNESQNWQVDLPSNYLSMANKKFCFLKVIYNALFSRKYKLIHLAGWSGLINLSLIFLSRMCRVPIVVETDTCLSPLIPWWKRVVKRAIYPFLFKFPKLFFPGGLRQGVYLQHYGVSKKKIIYAQMTVNVEEIQAYVNQYPEERRQNFRQQYNISSKDTLFLYVGRLLDWKGIEELLAAFRKLDCSRTHLWIVGDGDMRQHVEAEARHRSNIQYFGRKSDEELLDIYIAADVVVVPSHHEPWGLVVNEAMATKNAVIVSDQVGCADDLIKPGDTGLICAAKNAEDLKKTMKLLVDNQHMQNHLKQGAWDLISAWTLRNEAKNVVEGWGIVVTQEGLERCVHEREK